MMNYENFLRMISTDFNRVNLIPSADEILCEEMRKQLYKTYGEQLPVRNNNIQNIISKLPQ